MPDSKLCEVTPLPMLPTCATSTGGITVPRRKENTVEVFPKWSISAIPTYKLFPLILARYQATKPAVALLTTFSHQSFSPQKNSTIQRLTVLETPGTYTVKTGANDRGWKTKQNKRGKKKTKKHLVYSNMRSQNMREDNAWVSGSGLASTRSSLPVVDP